MTMGSIFSAIFNKFYNSKKQLRILMLGLDGAGKTTILYRIKLGVITRTIPTVGFNVESVEFANSKFTVWDVGGQDKLRRLWRHYFAHTQGIIFVVDSCDRDRIDDAAAELKSLIYEPDLQGVTLVIFANKQDIPEAMTLSEITEKLKLRDIKDREWHIQSVCALKGTGLSEGFQWLSDEIHKVSHGY